MSRASARAIKDFNDRIHKAGSNLPTEQKKVEHVKDITSEVFKSPTTGRNTKLGRRVEKPQDPKAGGPSGQKDNAKHNKKHANK